MEISDLTYKIVAYLEIPAFNTDDCIDWATEMLMLGYESENLLILAGIVKPSNYHEIISYLNKALTELNIEIKTGEEGILSYSSYYINKISKSENVQENLKMIYGFCQRKNYEKIIYDFYLLHWAWGEIDYGNEYTCYWKNVNKTSIEKTVIATAKKWILDYNKLIEIKKIKG